MADQIPDSAKLLPCPNPWCDCPDSLFVQPLDRKTLFGVQCACGFEGPVMDSKQRAIAAWNTRAAPPAMDREAVEKVTSAMLLGRSWMRHSPTCRSIVGEATDDGCRVDCSCGLADVLSSFDAAMFGVDPALFGLDPTLSTLSADAIRQGEGKWRHVKRGTVYQVIGTAELQAGQPQLEHAELVIYRGEDGKLWARNSGEFHDGRFVPATPASHASDGGKA